MEKKFEKIRLVYFEATDHVNQYTNERKFEVTLYVYPSLIIPNGMSVKDACNVTTYFSMKNELDNDLNECEPKCVKLIHEDLKKIGFVENKEDELGYIHSTKRHLVFKKHNLDHILPEVEGCLDLFVVDCNEKLFNKTSLGKRYCPWYNIDVKESEVRKFIDKKIR